MASKVMARRSRGPQAHGRLELDFMVESDNLKKKRDAVELNQEPLFFKEIQRYSSSPLQGFLDDLMVNSRSSLADTEATYCPCN